MTNITVMRGQTGEHNYRMISIKLNLLIDTRDEELSKELTDADEHI